MARRPPRRPRPKRHRPPDRDRREDRDRDDRKRREPRPVRREPPEPGAGTTTTVSDDQVAAEAMPATAGSADMTSASTTAPVPGESGAADEMEAFFSSGHGPALHYDLREQQAQSAETSTTAGGT